VKGGRSIEILPVAGGDRKTVLGAKVAVNGRLKEFQVQPSYAGGSWVPLHFGIGDATSARVTIRWPDGSAQDFGTLAAGAYRVPKGGVPTWLRAHELN
jgi:hypothetical protein